MGDSRGHLSANFGTRRDRSSASASVDENLHPDNTIGPSLRLG